MSGVDWRSDIIRFSGRSLRKQDLLHFLLERTITVSFLGILTRVLTENKKPHKGTLLLISSISYFTYRRH